MKKVLVALCVAFGVALTSFAVQAEDKPAQDPEKVFKRMDKDSDGKLTLEEFKGKREEEKAKKAFEKLDTDKDGKLSLEEFKKRPTPKPKGDK